MNIDNLTGIEFEQLCKKVLEEYGFRVETTKASGDGGIDLIAYSDKIFYKGKYIIQCKRYIGSVGEPVIRDLYGVVTAERANKGILITSGSFTNAAIKFAENKPIELIDSSILNRIIADDNRVENENNCKTTILNEDAYNYYLKQMSDSKCDYTVIIKFLEFILGYVIDVENEKQQSTQFEKLLTNDEENEERIVARLNEINSIDLFKSTVPHFIDNDIIKNIEFGLMKLSNSKLCRSEIGGLYYTDLCLKYSGIKQLLALDISSFFEERFRFLDCNGGICRRGGFIWSTYFNRNGQFPSNCELFNLYSLCNYFEYDIGFEKLNIKYPDNYLTDSELKFNNIDYRNIIESKSAIIIYPQLSFFGVGAKRKINRTYYNRINFTSYFDSLISEESRKEIIKKIDFLLSI